MCGISLTDPRQIIDLENRGMILLAICFSLKTVGSLKGLHNCDAGTEPGGVQRAPDPGLKQYHLSCCDMVV